MRLTGKAIAVTALSAALALLAAGGVWWSLPTAGPEANAAVVDRVTLLALGLMAVGLATLLAGLCFFRTLIKPLRELAGADAAGDKSWKPLDKLLARNDEIGHLARSLRERAQSLEQGLAALRQAQERLRTAQVLARIGSWELDLVTREMWGSEEGHRIYGLRQTPDNRMAYEVVREVPLPEDRPHMDRALMDLVEQGSEYALEFRIRRPLDGVVRTIFSRADLLLDSAGRPCKVVGTIQDVTELRRAEEEIRVRAEELSVLNTLGRDLNHDLSLDHTVSAALQGLLQALRPDLAFLCLREPEGLVLKDIQPVLKGPNPNTTPQLGQAVCGLANRDGRVIYCQDAKRDLDEEIWEHCRAAGVSSLAALPLLSGDETIGALGLASRQPRDFQLQAGFLETLANQVAAAITNARLFEALQNELGRRQATLQQLQESQDRFRAISDQSPLGISLVDSTGRYEYLNPAFVKMFGYDLADLPSRAAWFELAYPDLYQRQEVMVLWEEDLALIKQGSMSERTLQITCRDASVKSILLRVVGIASGGSFIIYEDITERLRTEQALRESETRFRRFIERLPIAIAVVAADATIEYLNPKFSQTFGYDLHDLPSLDHWWVLAYPDPEYRQEVVETWTQRVGQAHRANTEVEPLERTVSCKDGAKKIVTFFGSPVLDKTLVVLHDVTEQRLADLALAESEAKFRRFVEASPVGIHMYHLEDPGRLVLTGFNPAANRILDIEHQALVGLGLQEAFPGLADGEIPAHYLRAACQGQVWRNEEITYEHGRISGAYEVLVFQTTPGNVAVMFLDIAQRLRTQEELRILEQQLARSQKMEALGTLASGVAHDFNNILQALVGRVELLANDEKLSEATQQHIGKIRRSLVRASSLVARMLSFSRAGEARLRILDLNQEITSLVEMLAHTLPRMVRITTELASDLAPIRGDANRLEQLMLNLATNARDAMPDGGELLFRTSNRWLGDSAARSAGLATGQYVALEVSDTGQGMDEQTLNRIFEPFFSTKEPGKGTGLGLYSVYGIIREHQGAVACQSRPGRGTTFTMYFPRGEAETEPAPDEVPELGLSPNGEESLLLVDDEPEILASYREALVAQGYQVHLANCGEEALRQLEKQGQDIDLVVMDLNMPGMGGEKTLRLIKARHPRVAVIVASGYRDRRLKESVLAAGAEQFLAKPFDFKQLLVAVRRALARQGPTSSA